MKIDILTLFPDMFDSLNHSILGKAKADYSNVIVSGAIRMPDGISSCSSDPVDIKKSEKAKVKLSCETGSVDSNFKYKDYLLETTEVK